MLVITIIVMIILATAIILSLNSSRVLKKAKQAVNETNLQKIRELATLKWSEAYLDSQGKATEEELRQAVLDGLEGIDISQYTITVTTKGVNVDVICYYNTLSMAIADINSGTIGKNADVENENAVIKVNIQEGNPVVEVLNDINENEKIILDNDMTIILGGNTITFNDCMGFDTLNDKKNKIYIDGTAQGSQIVSVATSNKTACTIQVKAGNEIRVEGARLSSVSENGIARGISATKETSVHISNCDITARSNIDDGSVMGVYLGNNSNSTITDCKIESFLDSDKGRAYGIVNYGQSEIYNTTANGYSNYAKDYAVISVGIFSGENSSLTLKNCNAMGNHSGVSSYNNIYVDGGVYESYTHGGIYFVGHGENYVKNATLRPCEMPDGYTYDEPNKNPTGFYIGGGTGAENSNVTVYMDNCILSTTGASLVLRGSSGEKNNTLYISNSTITNGAKIRIDSDTHKLYIGRGNNFDATRVYTPSNMTQFDLTKVVFTTNEIYVKE